MKEVVLLTKILFKSSTGDGKQNGEKKTKTFSRMLIFVLAYGYIIGFISVISYFSITSLMIINKAEIFLNMIFTLLLGLELMHAIVATLNVLYFSKDIEILTPLPIKSKKIVAAKLNCLIISQYIMSAMLVLPGVLIYGYLQNLNLIYYLVGIIVLLLFPIIPISLIAILITLIMRFTKIIKNKEIVQYATIILTIIFIIVVQGFTGTSSNLEGEELALELVKTNSAVEKMSANFPIIKLAMNTLLNYNNLDGIYSFIILIVSTVFTFLISINIISKLYLDTIVSMETIKSKNVEKIDFSKGLKINNILNSYVKKEFKMLVRIPMFFMQCFIPAILFPLIVSVPAIISLKETTPDMNLLINDFSMFINTNYGLLCALAATMVFFVFNNASITAISRDGNNATFLKYIPIDYEKQIYLKMMPGFLLNIAPIIYILALILICIPGAQIKLLLYIITISLLINLLNNLLMVIVDLKNPKLNWITEQAVVKQNMNMFFGMFFIAIEMIIIFVLGIAISSLDILAACLITFFAFTNLCTKKYISNNKNNIFDKIN